MRAPAPMRIRPADGSAALLSRRMAAASSGTSPAPISEISWRWCSITRSSAWPRSRARSTMRAASTGSSSEQEAEDLALKLKTGALPAGIKYEQERTIGPSLGADSIREGIYAAIAGLVAVIIVMLVYYKKSGVNAVLALMLNTVLADGGAFLLRRDSDVAGNCGRHPDHRYGGRFERADLRAHPRGTA